MKARRKELITDLWNNTSTVNLIDMFEGIVGDTRYDRLCTIMMMYSWKM